MNGSLHDGDEPDPHNSAASPQPILARPLDLSPQSLHTGELPARRPPRRLLLPFCLLTAALTAVAAFWFIRQASTQSSTAPAQVTRYGEAPMYFNAVLGLPYCEVFINDRGPLRLYIDSGAGHILLLDDDHAEQVGLKPAASPIRSGGFGGEIDLHPAIVERLRLGSITAERATAGVSRLASPLLSAVDGILGAAAFASARVTFDFAHERLSVAPSSNADAPGNPLPIQSTRSGHVFATVQVDHEPADALIDTGAADTVLFKSWFAARWPDRHVASLPLPMLGIGPDFGTARPTSAGRITFAGRTDRLFGVVVDDQSAFVAGLGHKVDLVLGMNWFVQMRRLTIDYPTSRAWVEWIEEP